MPRGDLLGSLEYIVLLALVRLEENAYGMTVRREIEARTGRSVSIGAIYATLERLQTKGYVRSFIGEPTAERGGRAKRLFSHRNRRASSIENDARDDAEDDGGLEKTVGHNVTQRSPSRLATWLLACFLAEADKEAVIGDLIEECALRPSRSRVHLSWWYWSQVSRSIAPFVWIGVRRERWGAVFGAAVAAFILANVTEWVATKAIAMVVDWSVGGTGQFRRRPCGDGSGWLCRCLASSSCVGRGGVPHRLDGDCLHGNDGCGRDGSSLVSHRLFDIWSAGRIGRWSSPAEDTMQKVILASMLIWCAVADSHNVAAQQPTTGADSVSKQIIGMERAALDRWITLDPQGYLDLYVTDVTYFDPTTDKRVDGLQAIQARLAPMKNAKVPFTDRRYEMIDPKVQLLGDVALLTFNLVNYGKLPDRPESVVARWNSTEVYGRIDGKWRLMHSHWSFVRPEVKPPGM